MGLVRFHPGWTRHAFVHDCEPAVAIGESSETAIHGAPMERHGRENVILAVGAGRSH